VPVLCETLGLSPPTYTLTSTLPDVPNNAFFSCTAVFQPIAGLPNPAAEVRNIYGKKNAKEQCARKLVVLLEKVIAWRRSGKIGRFVDTDQNHESVLGKGLEEVIEKV
jgi:hypothetical protein